MSQVVSYDLLELSDDDKGFYQKASAASAASFKRRGRYVWSSLALLTVAGDAQRRRYRRTEVGTRT